MKLIKEIMEAHRATLQEMARMYEADGSEGMSSVGFFLGKADRQIGRILLDPAVQDEPQPKEPDTTEFPDG